MESLLSAGLILAGMAAVVLAFRWLIHRPRISYNDPPGVRTVVVFSGDDPEFFRDDKPEGMFVGQRLFHALCDGLGDRQIQIERRGHEEFAHRADCRVDGVPLALILEWVDGLWVASVEWVPRTRAEARHMAWTHEVFPPPDSAALRHMLSSLDRWLKGHPGLSEIRWHRKEKWLGKDRSQPHDEPFPAG